MIMLHLDLTNTHSIAHITNKVFHLSSPMFTTSNTKPPYYEKEKHFITCFIVFT